MWYPERKGLRGISGIHFNRRLPRLDSEDTEWQEWLDRHPDSKIMK
jgi:hypothetical protein